MKAAKKTQLSPARPLASPARPWAANAPAPRRKPAAPKPKRPAKPRAVQEWQLQAAAVRDLRRALDVYRAEGEPEPFLFAGDMNAARRTLAESGRAVATGMEAGEPDMRFYLAGGRVGLIEVKAGRGIASAKQKARHRALSRLGHAVEIIKAKTEDEARALVVALVDGWTGGAVSSALARWDSKQHGAMLAAANDNGEKQ